MIRLSLESREVCNVSGDCTPHSESSGKCVGCLNSSISSDETNLRFSREFSLTIPQIGGYSKLEKLIFFSTSMIYKSVDESGAIPLMRLIEVFTSWLIRLLRAWKVSICLFKFRSIQQPFYVVIWHNIRVTAGDLTHHSPVGFESDTGPQGAIVFFEPGLAGAIPVIYHQRQFSRRHITIATDSINCLHSLSPSYMPIVAKSPWYVIQKPPYPSLAW